MAKAKVTRKWVSDNFYCCSVGYCDLQYLLHCVNADYYTCGVYGWNFDVYTFGNYAITTGYRGMIENCKTDKNVSSREYDQKARDLISKSSYDYEDMRKEVNKLLEDFLNKKFMTEGIRVY